MPDAGACPNCQRPIARDEIVCVSCGYSRHTRTIAATAVRPRSIVAHILHALRLILLHPLVIGLAASAIAILLARGYAGDALSIQLYSVLTGVVGIVSIILHARYFWFEASLRSALEHRIFGWVAAVFSSDSPPLLRISTMLAITMIACTGWLRLEAAREANPPNTQPIGSPTVREGSDQPQTPEALPPQ